MTLRVAPPAPATAEALPEIARLMERVVPRDRPWAPDLAWQYLENPSGLARYVNAYSEAGDLVAHYGVLPMPPLADAPVTLAGTYLSLNVVADPAATVPGLMIATTRALYRSIQDEGPALVVGITNENSFQGFVRVLGFRALGRLSLTVHPPGRWPVVDTPRAFTSSPAHLAWRTARPGVRAFADQAKGTLMVRLQHLGLPIDVVLTTGQESGAVGRLSLPASAGLAPRLYAGFGGRVRGGVAVPARMRPSPLEYVFRVFGGGGPNDVLERHLAARRFEFLDFDVV